MTALEVLDLAYAHGLRLRCIFRVADPAMADVKEMVGFHTQAEGQLHAGTRSIVWLSW